jgi:hypothetical protein
MSFTRIQKAAFRTISQIGIHYRSSSLSKSLDGLAGGAPRAGDRFPWVRLKFDAGGQVEDVFRRLDDTHFNLIVVGQPSPDGVPELLDLLHVHAVAQDPANDAELSSAGIPQPSFYLLRPDGYVGLCGARLDPAAIARYVSASLRFAGQSA